MRLQYDFITTGKDQEVCIIQVGSDGVGLEGQERHLRKDFAKISSAREYVDVSVLAILCDSRLVGNSHAATSSTICWETVRRVEGIAALKTEGKSL